MVKDDTIGTTGETHWLVTTLDYGRVKGDRVSYAIRENCPKRWEERNLVASEGINTGTGWFKVPFPSWEHCTDAQDALTALNETVWATSSIVPDGLSFLVVRHASVEAKNAAMKVVVDILVQARIAMVLASDPEDNWDNRPDEGEPEFAFIPFDDADVGYDFYDSFEDSLDRPDPVG